MDNIKTLIPTWFTTEEKLMLCPFWMENCDQLLFEIVTKDWKRKNSYSVAKLLLSLELLKNFEKQSTSIFENVLDMHLMKQAKKNGKMVSSAENVDEHCFKQPNSTIVRIFENLIYPQLYPLKKIQHSRE